MRSIDNVFRLGLKEIRSLTHDRVLFLLVVWSFTFGVYSAATGESRELHNVPVAVVDDDRSALSLRIVSAFYGPYFKVPEYIAADDADPGLDSGHYTFVLVIPAGFQRDVLAGRAPGIQVNVDATQMTQATTGTGYVQNIVSGEVDEFMRGVRTVAPRAVELAVRVKFNPNLTGIWFGGIMELVNNITMLSIILAGAALIREREHGTLEHLLVMPLTPAEIMAAKVWSTALVVLVAAALSLAVVIQGLLDVPVSGSIALFLFGAALHLFSTTAIGLFLAMIARSMPQFALLVILVVLPLQMLSGGVTPRESMPELVQTIMLAAPTTHFVSFAQAILYRGAGFSVVWPSFLAIITIGAVFFAFSLSRFRRSLAG